MHSFNDHKTSPSAVVLGEADEFVIVASNTVLLVAGVVIRVSGSPSRSDVAYCPTVQAHLGLSGLPAISSPSMSHCTSPIVFLITNARV